MQDIYSVKNRELIEYTVYTGIQNAVKRSVTRNNE